MAGRRMVLIPALVAGAVLACVAAVLAAHATASAQSAATVITVDTAVDRVALKDGRCSLREAIRNAQDDSKTHPECEAGGAEETVVFADRVSGETVTLNPALGQLTVFGTDLVVNGGTEGVTISGGGETRVFWVGGSTLTLKNLTVANGFASDANSSSNAGGGVHISSGTVTVKGSTFLNNSAPRGGGGGIYNGGVLTVKTSAFSKNAASNSGGGIYNGSNDELAVTRSTFSGNVARTGYGGGIYNDGNDEGTVAVKNSTFFRNSAEACGGGICNRNQGAIAVTSSTFSENGARYGGGVWGPVSGKSTLSNTIVAESTSGGNCAGTVADGRYNVSSDASCSFAEPTSKNDTDPGFAPSGFRNRGGPTKTIGIRPTSPTVDAIPVGDNGCATEVKTDQRGVRRPQGAGCDVGSVEKKEPSATR